MERLTNRGIRFGWDCRRLFGEDRAGHEALCDDDRGKTLQSFDGCIRWMTEPHLFGKVFAKEQRRDMPVEKFVDKFAGAEIQEALAYLLRENLRLRIKEEYLALPVDRFVENKEAQSYGENGYAGTGASDESISRTSPPPPDARNYRR